MPRSQRSLLSLVLLVLAVSAGVQWWHGARDARLGEAIAMRAAPGDIRLIASDTCEPCEAARHWLTRHQVRFTECSIERDAQCAGAFGSTGAAGTPVLVVRGKAQTGFDPQRVLDALG